jgi:hypothetical protein
MNPNTYGEAVTPNLFNMTVRASDGTIIFLDYKLIHSEAFVSDEAEQILASIIREAIVRVYHDYYYRVDLGPTVRPQYHIVSHDLYCSCTLEVDCAAVTAVKMYLRNGGNSAKTPRPGYFLTVPHVCPVCGSKVYYYPRLSSNNRGIGWVCHHGGTSHYWQHELAVLQAVYAEKWKRLGLNPFTFKKEVSSFNFKDGYDPEREPS